MNKLGIAATGLLLGLISSAGCAHQRVRNVSGCWIRENENRIGDTRQVIAVCEPRAPKDSNDPLVRAMETCLFHAEMGWYTHAIEKLQAGKQSPAPFDWEGETQRCRDGADLIAQRKLSELELKSASAEARAQKLEDDNRELRQTLIACVEKTPTAIAEAHSTSGSDSDSDSVSRDSKKVTGTPRRPLAPGASPAPNASATPAPGTVTPTPTSTTTAIPQVTPTAAGCVPAKVRPQ